MHWQCPRCGFTSQYKRKCDECHQNIRAEDEWFKSQDGSVYLCSDCFWSGVMFDENIPGLHHDTGQIRITRGWRKRLNYALNNAICFFSGKGGR
jgi:hypothetical protein